MAQHRSHFAHDKAIRFDVGVRRPQASIQVRPIEQLIRFVASVAPAQIHVVRVEEEEEEEAYMDETMVGRAENAHGCSTLLF